MTDPTLPSSQPAEHRLWRRIPNWYRARADREGSALRGLLASLGAGLDTARDDVWRLLNDMFVETCAPELIPLIGDLVGVSVDPQIPVQRQRHQVKYGLHLRRRAGTRGQLETLAWQLSGFRVTVEEAPLPLAGESGPVDLHIVLRVARPVARVRSVMQRIGPDLFAVDPDRPVGLRYADGTPILRTDDPESVVGRGRDIALQLSGDLRFSGPLAPLFVALEPDDMPVVAQGTLAIDPETGRVAGPPGPTPGSRAGRGYSIACWAPRGAEQVSGSPAHLGAGHFRFSPAGRSDALTDAEGCILVLHREQDGAPPPIAPDQRLLVAQDPASTWPFLLYPAGVAPDDADPLPLDRDGLDTLFRIEDRWGWTLFPRVRWSTVLSPAPPPDDLVEVDPSRGRFLVGAAHRDTAMTTHAYRRFDVDAIIRRTHDAMRHAVPLGRRASFTFRDTAPGQTRRFDP